MKWLVSKNNSAWGIKKDSQGNQFYSHVIDFPDDKNDKNKDIFLNKYIFNTVDWKSDIAKMPDTGNNPRDANKTIFRVDIKNYPNETIDSLLNKDFAVCLTDETTDKKYSFWAIEGKLLGSNNAIIEFEATRDWIFEKGINNLFKDNSQVIIDRSHVKDVISNDLWNIGMNSDNANFEEIEEFSENNYYPTQQSKILIDYTNDIIKPNNADKIYFYKRIGDYIGYYDFSDKKFKKFLTHISNDGDLNWFTCYEDNNQKWHLVWAYTKGNDLVFNEYNLQTQKQKSKTYYTSPHGQNNKCFYIDNRTNSFVALIGNDLSPKIAWITEWIMDDTKDIKTDFIRFPQLVNANKVMGSISICSYNNLVYISFTDAYIVSLHLNLRQYIATYNQTESNAKLETYHSDYDEINAYSNIYTNDGWNFNRYGKIKVRVDFKTYYKYYLSNNEWTNLDVNFDNVNCYYTSITRTSPENTIYNNGFGGYWYNGRYTDYDKYTVCYTQTNSGQIKIKFSENKYQFTLNDVILEEDNINYEYISYYYFHSSTPNITIDRVNEILNNSAFAIIQCQLKENENNKNEFILDLGKEKKDGNIVFTNPPKTIINNLGVDVENNYYSFILPFEKFSYEGFSYRDNIFSTVYKLIQSSPFIYNIRFQPFGIIPVGEFNFKISGSEDDWFIDMSLKDENKSTFKPVKVKSNINNLNTTWLFKKQVIAWDNETPCHIINDSSSYDKDISKNFIINNIAKLHRNPYCRDYLKTTTGLEMYIYPQNLIKKYSIQLSYTWAVDVNHLIYKVKDLDNEDGYYNSDYTYGIIGQEINNYGFIVTNEAFSNYMANNRNQLEQRSRKWQIDKSYAKTNYGVNLGKNILSLLNAISGAIAGTALTPVTGGAGLALGVGVLANSGLNIASTVTNYQQQMANIENEIAMQKMMLQDLKNAPNTLIGNGDDMNGILTKTSITPLKVHEELWPILKESCAWYFQLFGSKINSRPRNINNYIGNKYHFNFIKCQSAFENYREDVPMNNITRQITDKSLADGITIWHFRDENTFKGIKNWDVNNVDTNLAINGLDLSQPLK